MVVTKRVGRETARNDVVDGVPVHRLPPCGPRSGLQKWLMTPSVLWTMVRRRHDFDVVYSPDYRGIGLAGLLAARLLGKPAVMGTAALGVINAANLDPLLRRFGIRPGGAIARLVKRPFHRVYTSADAYPAITRAIAEEAVAAGVAPGRVHYLPNSVDTARFAPASAAERSALRAELGLPAGETVCLFLARLSREKGLMDLMAAWREIDAPATRLVVVGPDMTGHPFDVGPAAREFASKHRMEDRVKFVGPTSAPERWLRAADVMAQPSHWEAAPFGVVEAMASGLAIVATRVGGMAEFLEDGRDAVLCAPRDIRGLSAALTRVLGDPGLRERLGAAARATAVPRVRSGSHLRQVCGAVPPGRRRPALRGASQRRLWAWRGRPRNGWRPASLAPVGRADSVAGHARAPTRCPSGTLRQPTRRRPGPWPGGRESASRRSRTRGPARWSPSRPSIAHRVGTTAVSRCSHAGKTKVGTHAPPSMTRSSVATIEMPRVPSGVRPMLEINRPKAAVIQRERHRDCDEACHAPFHADAKRDAREQEEEEQDEQRQERGG